MSNGSRYMGLVKYSGSFPTAGTMRNGTLYPRPPLALLMRGKEFSLWATLRSVDSRRAVFTGSRRASSMLPTQIAMGKEIRMWDPATRKATFSGPRRRESGKFFTSTVEPGGMLNPEWCEWLMGFPAGWTELER